MSADADDADRPSGSPLMRHLSGRIDPLTSAVLVFPLLAVYQLGILGGRGNNGVDFITRALIGAARRDLGNYLVIIGAMLAVYVAVIVILRRRGSFHPRAFVPMLLESGFYALTMGTLIVFVMSAFLPPATGLVLHDLAASPPGAGHDPLALSDTGALDVLVISAGAGFHEELVFRLGVMGGLGWLLSGITGPKRAWIIALVVSSLVFSLAHHIGPMGEAFTFGAFVYRTLAGVFFALVYQIRGFAVAAWTHALYDVYVLSLA